VQDLTIEDKEPHAIQFLCKRTRSADDSWPLVAAAHLASARGSPPGEVASRPAEGWLQSYVDIDPRRATAMGMGHPGMIDHAL